MALIISFLKNSLSVYNKVIIGQGEEEDIFLRKIKEDLKNSPKKKKLKGIEIERKDRPSFCATRLTNCL